MSEFDSLYTLEYKGPKGWEIQWTGNDLEDVLDWFRRNVEENEYQIRITSPAPKRPANVVRISEKAIAEVKAWSEWDGAA